MSFHNKRQNLHSDFYCKVSLTSFLVLEIVLGLSSNLMVLVLYCMKQNLISSVSNVITMNLHVVDVLVSSPSIDPQDG